ncbi:MAG: hypothetical protein HDQ88_08935 [Clostridia bacterium]|nr:hypothetical protein [Clostridia bacterium]
MWYHLMTDLENRFASLEQAERYVRKLNEHKLKVRPYIPRHVMPKENSTIPRICVSPHPVLCVQSIGVIGMFRRCVAGHPDSKSYATKGNEVYPIIKLTFNDTPHVLWPDKNLVPDTYDSLEHWLLSPTYCKSAELVWFHMWSIDACPENITLVDSLDCYTTDKIRNKNFDHPWLNGKGHILDSSEMEDC